MSPVAGGGLLILVLGFLLMFVGATDDEEGRSLPLFVIGLYLTAFGCVLFAVAFTVPA